MCMLFKCQRCKTAKKTTEKTKTKLKLQLFQLKTEKEDLELLLCSVVFCILTLLRIMKVSTAGLKRRLTFQTQFIYSSSAEYVQ